VLSTRAFWSVVARRRFSAPARRPFTMTHSGDRGDQVSAKMRRSAAPPMGL
jgi:hypothetical protein